MAPFLPRNNDHGRPAFPEPPVCHTFAPGDLVVWKRGMKNHRVPAHGEPAVVLEVLATPVLDTEKDSGYTYFREPLDLVLGLFIDEGACRGEFLAWHFDSRRFELWTSGEQGA
jgi:hypothetical protein